MRPALWWFPAMAALSLVTSSAAPGGSQLRALDASEPIPYAIDATATASDHAPQDRELARWALADWARASGGALRFREAPEAEALVRVSWVPATGGLYGEMRPFVRNGRTGAIVYIRPVTAALGDEIGRRAARDPLFRDTVVYLTCLHELGHALGLPHTDAYDDIMYFFGYGGDIPGYFARYHDRLTARDDIRRESGVSPEDRRRLRALYPSAR